MRSIIVAAALGLASVAPVSAQMPNPQQFLGGLLTGNQNQDQAIRDAFERGYQRGRQDEARLQRERASNERPRGREDDRYRRPDDRSGTYGGRDDRGYNPSLGQPNSYSR